MLLFFLVWRGFDFLVALLVPHLIPYLGFFPYGEIFKEYGLPTFISSFANFDGAQYLTLVREGYNTYTQAYFPLYFLLVKAVALLFPTPGAIRAHNDMLSAVLVSNVFLCWDYFCLKNISCHFEPKERDPATVGSVRRYR